MRCPRTRSLILLAIFIFESCSHENASISNDEYEEVKIEIESKDYTPDIFPQYVHGQKGLYAYYRKNLNFSHQISTQGGDGKVIVSFTVSKDGSVKDVRVVRSVNEELDKESIRVTSGLNGWKPAIKNGKPVDFVYKLPIRFF